jgi:hypothetical protein
MFCNAQVISGETISYKELIKYFFKYAHIKQRKMKKPYNFFLACAMLVLSGTLAGKEITTGSLIDEMLSLQRLTEYPDVSYKTVQYSSFDRRSTVPSGKGWFTNSDGFGREPIPGFEKVLREPGTDNIGEYLICDVKGPGAIVRMWTANINGEIRIYLDDSAIPLYEGPAEKFIWNTAAAISGDEELNSMEQIFRQYDASYFPIPFSKGCKMEWIGDLRKLHFYHIQIRQFSAPLAIKTFNTGDVKLYASKIGNVGKVFSDPDKELDYSSYQALNFSESIPAGTTKNIFKIEGERSIMKFSMKIDAKDIARALRQTIINIYFDDASIPQVQSPVGDFFGTAAGIDPYTSLPFSVAEDGTLTCRFIMPFRANAVIDIENRSGENIGIASSVRIGEYKWKENTSMHFRARWRTNHNMVASNLRPQDMPYLVAIGKGRVVGASAFLMNPSQVPSSSGNWWGEGDEKIFIDDDIVPSIFGTGSEDYFNYSWSIDKLFDYAYCGQPRNDGPANRGFVTNYRYQINDDLLFNNNIAFYMELLSHGVVPGFSYGRITYLYSFSDLVDDHIMITDEDIRHLTLPVWNEVIAYRGSGNSVFHEAETLIKSKDGIKAVKGNLWTKGSMLTWNPKKEGDRIVINIPVEKDGKVRLTLTTGDSPESGKIRIYFKDNETEDIFFDLKTKYATVSRNHVLKTVELKRGSNDLVLENLNNGVNKVGIDFIWIQYQQ